MGRKNFLTVKQKNFLRITIGVERLSLFHPRLRRQLTQNFFHYHWENFLSINHCHFFLKKTLFFLFFFFNHWSHTTRKKIGSESRDNFFLLFERRKEIKSSGERKWKKICYIIRVPFFTVKWQKKVKWRRKKLKIRRNIATKKFTRTATVRPGRMAARLRVNLFFV